MSADELNLYKSRLLADVVAEVALVNGKEVVSLLKDFLEHLRAISQQNEAIPVQASWVDEFAGVWADDERSAEETVRQIKSSRTDNKSITL